MSAVVGRTEAIAVAENYMRDSGYKHGPCIGCRPIGPTGTLFWEVEFAYKGKTERSETADPPSIMLKVNTSTKEVRSVYLM
ncbi:hypothetical protein Pla108_23200 [Botrimarina colliarenosi]|uniref:Uncharacterized protein n=1 Tax=Botrimarina colliarenosi TaxID=2528001 RepID=A0A5C6AIU9_9BACT|nr:hypothetical protein Pla108_23200 [Botrimarina colliarenosi]